MSPRKIEQVLFLLVVGAIFAYAAIDAGSFPAKARVYPRTVSLVALVLVVVEIVLTLTRKPKAEVEHAAPPAPTLGPAVKRIFPYLVWIAGYYLFIYLFGLLPASALFIFAFLTTVGRVRWYFSATGSVVLVLALMGISKLMTLHWPPAQVMTWFGGG